MRFFHHSVLIAAGIIVLTVTMVGCHGSSTEGTASHGQAVALDSCRLSDTTSFVKSGGERCAIYADAHIVYPKGFNNKAATEQLQRLFAAFVLNAPDSLNLNDAMRATVSNTLHQYDFVELPADDQGAEDDGAQLVYKYNTTTTVNRSVMTPVVKKPRDTPSPFPRTRATSARPSCMSSAVISRQAARRR